ncbi:MAG: hypothetical protein J0M23_07220 [Rickettsiales bacterium]|nr:hypothetical protein [Rickettsiales bacterium]
MLVHESSERYDQRQNWVRYRLFHDNFTLFEFEGYTIKNKQVSGLFDRKLVTDISLLNLDKQENLYNQVKEKELYLNEKLKFSRLLNIDYRYVIYSYIPELLNVYHVYENTIELKKSYNSFCSFAEGTLSLRDLKMLSKYFEDGLPQIDKIMRDRCKIPWMGNLDSVLAINGIPVAIIEFQTTIRDRVKDHCNNKWFQTTNFRKGDEQRWMVLDIVARQAKLPLVIIVWSPNEIDGDIKFKIVEKINYSTEFTYDKKQKVGLIYSKKILVKYQELIKYLLALREAE